MKKAILVFSRQFTRTLRSICMIAGMLLFCTWDANAIDLMEKDGWQFKFNGLAVGYMYNDSSRSMTETPGNPPVARQGTPDGDNGRTSFSARASRFGFTAFAPTTATGWKTKGFVEADFMGYDPNPGSAAGNSENSFVNNATLRIRHAYLNAENNGWQILVGQYWSLLAWGEDYALTNLSLPPVAGIVQMRNVQARAVKTTPLTETIDLQAGLSVTRPPQRDAEIPAGEWAARLFFKNRKAGFTIWSQDQHTEAMSLAISGTVRAFETGVTNNTTNKTRLIGNAVLVSGMIPILTSSNGTDYHNTLSLTGMFSTGKGYADTFPGYNGNMPQYNYNNGVQANIDASEGGLPINGGPFTLINLQAVSAQLQYYFPKGPLQDVVMMFGYGNLYSDNIKDMIPAAGKVAYNESEVFVGNIFYDFTSRIRAGMEYMHHETHYIDGVAGKNDRIFAMAMYRF